MGISTPHRLVLPRHDRLCYTQDSSMEHTLPQLPAPRDDASGQPPVPSGHRPVDRALVNAARALRDALRANGHPVIAVGPGVDQIVVYLDRASRRCTDVSVFENYPVRTLRIKP